MIETALAKPITRNIENPPHYPRGGLLEKIGIPVTSPIVIAAKGIGMAQAILDRVPPKFKLPFTKMETASKYSTRRLKDSLNNLHNKLDYVRIKRRRCARCGTKHSSYEECQSKEMGRMGPFKFPRFNISKLASNTSGLS